MIFAWWNWQVRWTFIKGLVSPCHDDIVAEPAPWDCVKGSQIWAGSLWIRATEEMDAGVSGPPSNASTQEKKPGHKGQKQCASFWHRWQDKNSFQTTKMNTKWNRIDPKYLDNAEPAFIFNTRMCWGGFGCGLILNIFSVTVHSWGVRNQY